jgi:hypothetical protein
MTPTDMQHNVGPSFALSVEAKVQYQTCVNGNWAEQSQLATNGLQFLDTGGGGYGITQTGPGGGSFAGKNDTVSP